MTVRGLIIVAALSILGACGAQEKQIAQPREPDPSATGYYCQMGLAEHAGPKGQILPKGWTEPLWFSSVRDALTYVEMEIVSDREMAGFWVNDMAEGTWDRPAPGAWVAAGEAWYVVGSRTSSGMGGSEAVPFKARNAAEAFAATKGGRVVDYAEAKRTIAAEPSPESAGET